MEIHIVACFPGSLHTEQIPLLCVGGHFLVDQMGFHMIELTSNHILPKVVSLPSGIDVRF